jgi:urease accessory protein UreF
MNAVRNTVCNAVTLFVTEAVTNTVHNGARTTVQNQNQNQIVLTVVCGVCGQGPIPSNGDLRAPSIGFGAKE